MYYPSSRGIKRPRREPNNSLVASAQVIFLSTKFPLVLRFQLNEQQKLKLVHVWNWQCGKEFAYRSADWYSVVGEDYCLSVFGVNCLQLEVLGCLNSEGGDSKLQRKLIIIHRSVWSDIRTDFNVYQFCSEHSGILLKCVIFDNIKRNFLPI